jgi:hypothetical protein
MKKNILASLLLAFATAFVLAENLGTPSLVGDLSSSNDYVYTADQADAVVTAARTAAVSYTTAVSNKFEEAISAIPIYTHPSYTARTGKPTANASPGFGGTFTVSQIKSDTTGHVTDAVDRTITIPNAAATTSAAGLMSAADKTALDSLSSGSVLKTTVSAALTAQDISSADDIDTLNETIAELKKIIAVLEALD